MVLRAPAPSRNGSFAANAKCEKAPCNRTSDLTGERPGAGGSVSPLRAYETRRAPKLWPTRCTRSAGTAACQRDMTGPSPSRPIRPARAFIDQ